MGGAVVVVGEGSSVIDVAVGVARATVGALATGTIANCSAMRGEVRVTGAVACVFVGAVPVKIVAFRASAMGVTGATGGTDAPLSVFFGGVF